MDNEIKNEKSLENEELNSKENEKVINITNTKRQPKKQKSKYIWVVEVGLLALVLSMMFSVLSEYLLVDANIIIVLVVIVVLLAANVIFDMIGLAFASCKIEPLMSMASRKLKGSKLAINLVKNADKVSSICSDVIGDICGILCGAAGVTVAVVLTGSLSGSAEILIGAAVSAVIAGLTIFFKAICKNLAINKSTEIVMFVSKFLTFFSFKKNK